MAADWNLLSERKESPFYGELIRKVDLWRYQECRSLSLEEFGQVFSSEVAAQDPHPTLIGYSMGGRLALHAIEARPNLWKRVILLSTHPGLCTEEEKTQRRIKDAEWSAIALQTEWSTFLEQWHGQSILAGAPMGLPDRAALSARRLAIGRAFNAWSLGEQKDFRELPPSCPVSIISGEQDKKYTSLMHEFRSPKITRHLIRKAGHRVLWENPAECLAQMAEAF